MITVEHSYWPIRFLVLTRSIRVPLRRHAEWSDYSILQLCSQAFLKASLTFGVTSWGGVWSLLYPSSIGSSEYPLSSRVESVLFLSRDSLIEREEFVEFYELPIPKLTELIQIIPSCTSLASSLSLISIWSK